MGGDLVRLSLWKWVLGVGVVVMVGYFAVPGDEAKDIVYSTVGLASTILILVGIRLHRPPSAGGWCLIAGANACFVVGDVVLNYYDVILDTPAPVPSIADPIYLAGYPLLFVGVFLVCRTGRQTLGRDGWTDTAIVCVGALGLMWHYLMGPTLLSAPTGDASMELTPAHEVLGKLVSLAYPVMDLAVLSVVIGTLLRGTARGASDRLLVAAVVVMLLSDFIYDVQLLGGGFNNDSLVNGGFLLNYALMAAAATHPSIALVRSAPKAHGQVYWRWLPLVAGAAFVSPVLLLIDATTGMPVDLPVLASTSVVVLVLIALRVFWLFRRVHRQNEQLRDHGDSLRWALAAHRDLEDDLRHLALHDPLTGLANRTLLHDRVEQAVSGPMARPVALIFCDLDNFKGVNDGLGHGVGDELLVVVAKRLASLVRSLATVARLGGDEFGVLMEDAEQPSAATALAERIVAVIRQPIRVAEQEITLSVSVGVAVAVAGSTAAQLLSEADAAMYEAKAAGKDRVAVFETAMRSRLVEKMVLINYFPGSLRRDEFFLEYQPQVSLVTGEIQGFECLVRWQHPTLGRIDPARFIPLAEESRFIVPLGQWILRTACRQGAKWLADAPGQLSMSVNISGWQLQEPGFVQFVREVLASTGLRPCGLVVEVTESMLLTNPTGTAQVLRDLKSLGIRVAIDDFGTGYSSLSHLRQLPVDIIKIDKSFIDPLDDPDGEGEAFLATIVRLAADLNLATLAEGIEHESQREALVRLGCRSGQGYLMSRPLSASAATAFLAAHPRAPGALGVGERDPRTAAADAESQRRSRADRAAERAEVSAERVELAANRVEVAASRVEVVVDLIEQGGTGRIVG